MKINWGTGLVIGMVLFIAFILFLVITMTTNDRYNHDLVTEEYYKKEMAYQEEIDAEENLKLLPSALKTMQVVEGWQINFPKELDPSKINGTLFLYRPSNKQLDFDFPIVLSGSNLLIPDKRLLDGRWNIIIDWEYEGINYLYKESIRY